MQQRKFIAFAAADIGPREILEDFAIVEEFVTAGGLHLQVGICCDGVGGVKSGERAAYMTANTTIEVMKRSTDIVIPRLMTTAIKQANQQVYGDDTTGKSTIAMVAIHQDGQTPFGRMYIASVGDSNVFLIRDSDLKRLNTDHNVANEMILSGRASPQEAYSQQNAFHLTRAIGIGPDVEVDIGFHYNAPNYDEAVRRGNAGIALEEGDTIFACSDGLTDRGEDGQPYVKDEDFLRHAMDNDVERTARLYLTYALRSGTHDNVSVALIFIDSKKRRATAKGAGGLSGRQKVALGGFILVLLGAIVAMAMLLSQTSEDVGESEKTQQALANIITSTFEMQQTVDAYTPTPSNTPTPSPTPTPTATPTVRPTRSALNEVGLMYAEPNGSGMPVEERKAIAAEDSDSYVLVDGGADIGQPAGLFLQTGTEIELDRVNNDAGTELIELFIERDGDLFIQTGQYAIGGVEVSLFEDTNISFQSTAPCMAAKYTSDTEVVFACYSPDDDNCTYQLSRNDTGDIPGGQSVTINVEDRETIGLPSAVDYAQTVVYYETITSFFGEDAAACITSYVDQDNDRFLDEEDVCPDEFGVIEGCPDSDGDGIANQEDRCPRNSGPALYAGCPDVDADGLPDIDDRCPNRAGPPSLRGCPDADGDGIADRDDDCPFQAGDANNDGCPQPAGSN